MCVQNGDYYVTELPGGDDAPRMIVSLFSWTQAKFSAIRHTIS